MCPCPCWSRLRLTTIAFACMATLAHSQNAAPEVLPMGMTITPLLPPGVVFQTLNPGLPTLLDFKAGMAVTLAISPSGNTLLALTSGFNQNRDTNGNVDPATSNEYVVVYDVSRARPVQTQVLEIKTNAFDGLVWRPDGREFYVSGGPDDLIHVFVEQGGKWTESSSVPLNHNGVGLGLYGILPVVAGLDVTNKIVAEIDSIAPPEVFRNPARYKGAGPNSLALSPDEKWLYVTNGGTNSVSVISLGEAGDAREGATPRTVGLIPTAWYPNAVAASRDGSVLYVVNGKSIPGANSNACIDAASRYHRLR